jgi:hypothetical protein
MKLRILCTALAVAFCSPAGTASAATLQFSLTNVAPLDSISFEPTFLTGQDISDVILVTGTGSSMMVLPQLTFSLGVTSTAGMFPVVGGSLLPVLMPGDSLSFTLSNVDLLGTNALNFGASLFTQVAFADGSGNVLPQDLILTAGNIATFEAGALVLPDSGFPGPSSITSSTPALRLAVVPEPSSICLMLGMAGLALTRRRK